jgi:proteasome lid subunit RPN8/RPN11
MDALIFANAKLERLFAHHIKDRTEVGGWLFVSTEPATWPVKYSRRAVQTVLGVKAPWFINSYIFAPNEADKPEIQYRAFDWEKLFEMMNYNNNLELGLSLHFHSHPNGNEQPSPADWAFAGQYCRWSLYDAWFAIVTPWPVKLWPYRVNTGPGLPKNNGGPDGVFLSWRSKIVRSLIK